MLKGKKINLRTVRERDLETMLTLSSDMEARGEFFPVYLTTETGLRKRFNEDGMISEEKGNLLIVDKETDEILGSIAYYKPVFFYSAYEMGYILWRTDYRGKGIMPEAVELLTQHLFDAYPITRVQLQIEPGNIPSKRVAEKCGFTHEGTMRQALVMRGKARDISMYSLLRSEWDERKAKRL
ncbi:MAG: GNAT family N-acetyltransferase [Armatimonadetes bacterium]|nr:GNAT family N-acetyltransferase [Armatimonadota bacterium]